MTAPPIATSKDPDLKQFKRDLREHDFRCRKTISELPYRHAVLKEFYGGDADGMSFSAAATGSHIKVTPDVYEGIIRISCRLNRCSYEDFISNSEEFRQFITRAGAHDDWFESDASNPHCSSEARAAFEYGALDIADHPAAFKTRAEVETLVKIPHGIYERHEVSQSISVDATGHNLLTIYTADCAYEEQFTGKSSTDDQFVTCDNPNVEHNEWKGKIKQYITELESKPEMQMGDCDSTAIWAIAWHAALRAFDNSELQHRGIHAMQCNLMFQEANLSFGAAKGPHPRLNLSPLQQQLLPRADPNAEIKSHHFESRGGQPAALGGHAFVTILNPFTTHQYKASHVQATYAAGIGSNAITSPQLAMERITHAEVFANLRNGVNSKQILTLLAMDEQNPHIRAIIRKVQYANRHFESTASTCTIPDRPDSNAAKVHVEKLRHMINTSRTEAEQNAIAHIAQHKWHARGSVTISKDPSFEHGMLETITQEDFTVCIAHINSKHGGSSPVTVASYDGKDVGILATATPFDLNTGYFGTVALHPGWSQPTLGGNNEVVIPSLQNRIFSTDRLMSQPATVMSMFDVKTPHVPSALAWLAAKVKKDNPGMNSSMDFHNTTGAKLHHTHALPDFPAMDNTTGAKLNHTHAMSEFPSINNIETESAGMIFARAMRPLLAYCEVNIDQVARGGFVVMVNLGFTDDTPEIHTSTHNPISMSAVHELDAVAPRLVRDRVNISMNPRKFRRSFHHETESHPPDDTAQENPSPETESGLQTDGNSRPQEHSGRAHAAVCVRPQE
jgi:hypothetical protein